MEPPLKMPDGYDNKYEQLLKDVARAAGNPAAELTTFWPLVGHHYDRSLMIVGRSVNGWIAEIPAGQLADPTVRASVTADMRADAEQPRDRMLWVTDLAGKTTHHYNTNRSAFWRVLRELSLRLAGAVPESWPSYLAWTNLYKVAPAAGWNPLGDLQVAQRASAAELLELEIATLRPNRVLALTGRAWVAPFLAQMDHSIDWRTGLVEGVGRIGDAELVVARHPMAKPHNKFVTEVLDGFEAVNR